MTLAIDDPFTELAIRFVINIVAMLIFIFGMFYRRHRDKELATTAAIFNIFSFGVLSVLSAVEFNLAAGFGLFAILALFSLRSEQIDKIEISYFFGAVGLAVICSVIGTTHNFVIGIVTILLIAVYLIDHPKFMRSTVLMKVTLDRIDPHIFASPERMRKELAERFGVSVMSYRVRSINYVNELAMIDVYYEGERELGAKK